MLSNVDNLLTDMPRVKPSYEATAHKKVYHSDLYCAVPQGIPCLAWFTMVDDQYVCCLVELDERHRPIKTRLVPACFSSKLCYGTLVRGTLFTHVGQSFVCLDDIYFYKNQKMDHEPWTQKYAVLSNMLKRDMVQHAYNSKFVVFGLPLLASSNEALERIMTSVTYPMKAVKCYKDTTCMVVSMASFLQSLRSGATLVKPAFFGIRVDRRVVRLEHI